MKVHHDKLMKRSNLKYVKALMTQVSEKLHKIMTLHSILLQIFVMIPINNHLSRSRKKRQKNPYLNHHLIQLNECRNRARLIRQVMCKVMFSPQTNNRFKAQVNSKSNMKSLKKMNRKRLKNQYLSQVLSNRNNKINENHLSRLPLQIRAHHHQNQNDKLKNRMINN